MTRLMRPLAGALLALALLAGGAAAREEAPQRDITPRDVTELEAFGRAAISPDGRWAVYEKRGPYDTASRFDLGERVTWTITDLFVVDLTETAPTPALLLPGEGPGLLRVAWSPDSRRLLIARRRGEIYEYGVVTLADRSVRWTGLTPEFSRTSATAEWISADAVALSIRPDHSLPEILRDFGGAQARMAGNWKRSAEGREVSRQVLEARDGRVTTETPTPQGALVLLDVRDGGVRELAKGVIADFAASPDGRRVAVVKSVEPVPVTGPLVQLESANRARLSLVDIGTGQTSSPLDGWDIGYSLLRWSPDSSSLLVWAREDGEAWSSGRLMRVGAGGAAAAELGDLSPGDDGQAATNVRADWICGEPVLFARPDGGTRYDWYLLRDAAPPVNLTYALRAAPPRILSATADALYAVAEGGVWRIGAAGAERLTPQAVTLEAALPGDRDLTRRVGYNEAPRRDWTPVSDASGASVVQSGATGLNILGGADRDARMLAASPAAALVLERIGLEETLWLRRGGHSVRIDAVNSDRRNVRLIEPVPVRHPGVEGSEVTDWLYLPPGRAAGDLRGLIVDVYPGQSGAEGWYGPDVQAYGVRPNILAGAGFAVLSPASPRDLPADERGDVYVSAVDLAVDAALAAYPELPADRIGVFGHSFGGYMAMEVAVRSTRYRSYVASAGLYDMIGMWGETSPSARTQPEDRMLYRMTQAFVESGQGLMGTTPWEAPDLYLANSPFMRAGEVSAPVLLLTADMDFVPMSQTEMMFSALYREGKTARMVTYWGEHHAPFSPANIRDRYQEIFDWFDETLPAGATSGATAPAVVPMPEPRTRTPPRP